MATAPAPLPPKPGVNPNTDIATRETPAKPLSALALKVQKQQEEAAKGQTGYGTIPAELSQDTEEGSITFKLLDFVNGIGRSDSGKTEGCNLIVSSEFTVDVEGIGKVTYMVEGRLPLKAKVKVAGL